MAKLGQFVRAAGKFKDEDLVMWFLPISLTMFVFLRVQHTGHILL